MHCLVCARKRLQSNSIGAAGASSAYIQSRECCAGKLRENQRGEAETIALARNTTIHTMRLACADRCWYVWLVCAHIYEDTALEELVVSFR
jgi:hypothetical protein